GDVREDLEDRPDADVVAVAGDAVADLARTLDVFFERLNADQFSDLSVGQNAHGHSRRGGDRAAINTPPAPPEAGVNAPPCMVVAPPHPEAATAALTGRSCP